MKNIETDIIVVAGGVAGLASAIAAAEKGARVIIFEKATTTGGTGNMGMGPFAVESTLQRRKQVDLSKERAFKLFMDYTHWQVDALLVRAYIEKSADTIDWLEKMGVEFAHVSANFLGSYATWHVVKPEVGPPGPGSASTMLKKMTIRAKELGVQIFLRTPVKEVTKKENKISGVIAEGESGETIQATARAVIIATGGFGNNPHMIKKYTGYEWGRTIFSARIPGIDGDGIRMAWEAGAVQDKMNMELTHGMPFMVSDPTSSSGPGGLPYEFATFRQPNLMVNLQGERFMNEEVLSNTTFTGNAIARQKDGCAFNIFSGHTKSHFQEHGLDFLFPTHPGSSLDNLDETIQQVINQGYKHVFIADSLKELAIGTGIDSDGLRKTVEDYNWFCEIGHDDLFHKSHKYLRPIKGPKFYAGRNFPMGYGSLGGIKINHKAEVVTKNHDVIAGLYAAGTDACSIFADSYFFILPGNTMGFALNSGRIAGEHASKYSKQNGK